MQININSNLHCPDMHLWTPGTGTHSMSRLGTACQPQQIWISQGAECWGLLRRDKRGSKPLARKTFLPSASPASFVRPAGCEWLRETLLWGSLPSSTPAVCLTEPGRAFRAAGPWTFSLSAARQRGRGILPFREQWRVSSRGETLKLHLPACSCWGLFLEAKDKEIPFILFGWRYWLQGRGREQSSRQSDGRPHTAPSPSFSSSVWIQESLKGQSYSQSSKHGGTSKSGPAWLSRESKIYAALLAFFSLQWRESFFRGGWTSVRAERDRDWHRGFWFPVDAGGPFYGSRLLFD